MPFSLLFDSESCPCYMCTNPESKKSKQNFRKLLRQDHQNDLREYWEKAHIFKDSKEMSNYNEIMTSDGDMRILSAVALEKDLLSESQKVEALQQLGVHQFILSGNPQEAQKNLKIALELTKNKKPSQKLLFWISVTQDATVVWEECEKQRDLGNHSEALKKLNMWVDERGGIDEVKIWFPFP
ncbi:hypothetical protein BDZ94DRAFT_328482 [Collybia nuda]|uniref:Uncharacterized protein n=1 Tax=Collybia nuda TaxID=64659 RepID=A0A9P5YD22_9AGAR|nr:hypothetical protein BDZ94DRAFT_328482 [Collybia nuda]